MNGVNGSKGQKGEPGSYRKEIRNNYIGMERSFKSFYFLPETEILIQNSFSVEISFKNQLDTIKQTKFEPNKHIFQQETKDFPTSCQQNQILFGAHCQTEVFSFEVTSILCDAKEFESLFCNATQSSDSSCISSIENSESGMIINFYDQKGKKQTTKNAKCTKITAQEISKEFDKKCGYFCFPQQTEALYLHNNSFICSYVSPFSDQRSSMTDSKFSTLQVLSVEYYCSENDYQNEIFQEKNKEKNLQIALLQSQKEKEDIQIELLKEQLKQQKLQKEDQKKDFEIQLLKEKLKEEEENLRIRDLENKLNEMAKN